VSEATTETVPLTEPIDRALAISRHAAIDPDRPAVDSVAGNLSFGELNARINQLVRVLRRHGLRAGDAVALMCPNRPEFVEVYFAALRSGLRLTPLNWHLTGGEAGYIVNDCEARAFLSDARFSVAATEAVASAPRSTLRMSFGGSIAGFEDYEQALAVEGGGDIADPEPGSTMLYTSGTTGRPKGVYRLEHAPLSFRWSFDYRPGQDRDLAVGPLYHTAPAVYTLGTALLRGVGSVLVDGWDSERVLELVERYRITHAHMVPTMFHRLLALPDDVRRSYDLSSLRVIVHGAAPCPVALKQRMFEWLGPVVYEYYAATEGPGTCVEPAEWLARPGTVGHPDPPDHVIVGDEAGAPLPPGEVGFVYVKAPLSGRFEYFKDSERTAAAYRGDYFSVGDLGYLDDEGFLFLTDREANVIISGGVNIYPAEVDAVLLEHPGVEDVAVIGVPNEEWGEEVKAVVQLSASVQPSPQLAEELIEFCRQRLAHFKCPRSVGFTTDLPRQENGKIYKRVLRDRYRAYLQP
jgi:long-chain acyl-CoA synthetase